jgi:hypothetical protein
MDERIGHSPVRSHVDETPLVFAGQRIFVAAAQEALAIGLFEIVYLFRVLLVFAEVELHGPLVLFAAIDQPLIADPLGLHGRLRQ